MFGKLFSDSSVPRFASWLPVAALYARNQVAVFRDQDLVVEADELNHSGLGHLMQLIKLKVIPRRVKQVKVHGVNNEIARAVSSIENFIQDIVASIAVLYSHELSSADQDPEYSRAQQILFYLRSKFLKISSLRKKFAEIRNSGKRKALQTISNIFSAIVQRGASRRQRHVVAHAHASEHKQIAKA